MLAYIMIFCLVGVLVCLFAGNRKIANRSDSLGNGGSGRKWSHTQFGDYGS